MTEAARVHKKEVDASRVTLKRRRIGIKLIWELGGERR
jgi:hypothetical protein